MKKRESVYIRIYEKIKEEIVEGIYEKGAKLPSKRTLAENLGVSIITIEHAYSLLCEEGYVESKERSGYFVIFKKEDGFEYSLNKLNTGYLMEERKEKEEINFPVSVMAKTMRGVISDLQENIFLTSPAKGCLELREGIRRYLERNRGISVQTEQIIVGAGAEYLYHLIPDLLGKDKVYGIEIPSYEKIEQSYTNQGVEIERIPMTKEGMDSRYLKNSKADVLHISPYRSYPTGITATASKKYEYIRWAQKEGRFLVEDDFESEFSLLKKKEETLFSLSKEKNVIYMNTFSKTISSSLRIGYMVLPKEILEVYDKVLGYCSCPVPTYMQLVVARLIENGDFERHINRIRRKKRKEG